MNYKWKRILKLADFMEKLPRKRFNFAVFVGENWQGKPDLSCGTYACAAGWATTLPLFRKLGLVLDQFDNRVHLDNISSTYESLGEVFGTSFGVTDRLFFPDNYEQSRLKDSATPKQWARHARKIVAQLQKGEIE